MEDFITRLSPSSFPQVASRYKTSNGRTPLMLATTSRNWGIASLLVMMDIFKAGREAIHSQLSVTSSLLILNSVIGLGSRQSKTLKAVRWRQRLRKRKSNGGYSINLWCYPLPRYDTYASRSAYGSPFNDNTRSLVPLALIIHPNTLTPWLTLLLKRLRMATHTKPKWLLSQHRTKAQMWSPRSSNSTPQYSWALNQLKVLLRIQGYLPFIVMDWKQKRAIYQHERIRKTWNKWNANRNFIACAQFTSTSTCPETGVTCYQSC